MEQLSEKAFEILQKIPKSLIVPIILAVAGMICLCIGLIQISNAHKEAPEAPVQTGENPLAQVSPSALFGMEIDVEGAVVNPGVYKLSQNARVQEALIAAGGLSATADREVVAKSLNLASKLTDGMKIYVPRVGETQVAASSGVSQGTVLGVSTGLININSATSSELDNLPGVGPATSQKIINGRPYAAIEDLQTRKIVSQSVYIKIKDLVSIN